MVERILYVIPLHKKDERVIRAINSVSSGSSIGVVCGNLDIFEWMDTKNLPKNVTLGNADSKGMTYPELVNFAIEGLLKESDGIDFVSILEFDDQLTPNAEKILEDYLKDCGDADIIVPLTCMVKEDEKNTDIPILLGISNEVCFAPGMTDDYGLFDFNIMLRSNYIFVNGCYIRPRCFEEWGVFKKNILYFYDYEWALRMVYNGAIVKGIPKSTHFHYLSDDGLMESYKKMDKKVIEKWLGVARREYFFDQERDIE